MMAGFLPLMHAIPTSARHCVRCAALLSIPLVLAGCGGVGGQGQAGGSQYIPYSIASPDSLGARKTADSPISDHVSYWSGEGVRGAPRIVIDVSDQRAYFYKGNQLVGVSKVSSGKDGHPTPPGEFKIIQKNRHHKSNLYGNYVWPNGQIAQADVDVNRDPKPAGSSFDGAPMPYFMRFHNGVGMHAGYLPGFAASHGCVRMPNDMADIYFRNVEIGTPVTVRP